MNRLYSVPRFARQRLACRSLGEGRSLGAGRRGSVFLLVVAILSVVALMVITLTYTSKTESEAARNWTEGIQARISALTGAPAMAEFSAPSQNPAAVLVSAADEALPGDPPSPRLLPSPRLRQASRRTSPQPVEDSVPLRLAFETENVDENEADENLVVVREETPIAVASVFKANMRRLSPEEVQSRRAFRANNDADPDGRESTRFDPDEVLVPESFYPIDKIEGPLGVSRIEDESAKININAIAIAERETDQPSPRLRRARTPVRTTSTGMAALIDAPEPLPRIDVEAFAAFIEETLRRKEVRLDRSAEQIARDIALYRYGPDGQPGIRGVDDNGNGGAAQLDADEEDNDRDYIIDNPEERTWQLDADGLDNDRDGEIDEPGESVLTDRLDNDLDGEIDEEDEGVDDPAEFSPDPRRRPAGDDRPYRKVEDLLAIPGMTQEAFDALAPHLTTFSVSQPAVPGGDNGVTGFRQLDPNTASAEKIHAMLTREFPDLPRSLIGQYAVNLIDRRDADSIPTEMQFEDDPEIYRGVEIAPRINEVCPQVTSIDDKDDGQFVELFNPFSASMEIDGWRLEGAGVAVRLDGTIPSGGLLVVTDDYNNARDPDPEDERGFGSLYDIFGVVPTGLDRRIIVEPQMDLTNGADTIRLYDRQGNLMDSFSYKNGWFTGALTSFQRIDPRISDTQRTFATPLALNADYSEPAFERRELMEITEALWNRPFLSPLDLMLVPSNFVLEDDAGARKPVPWQLPGMAPGEGEHENLDLRLVDLFMPGATAPQPRILADAEALDLALDAADAEAETRARRKLEMQWREMRDRPPSFFGRVNLNTASPAVMASLPGVSEGMAATLAALREARMKGVALDPHVASSLSLGRQSLQDVPGEIWFKALGPQEEPRWQRLSDLLLDDELWGEAGLGDRLAAAYPFSRSVAFHSLSYRITTQNKLPAIAKAPAFAKAGALAKAGRRASVTAAERIVAGDRGRVETVSFEFARPRYYRSTDNDLRFAEPAQKKRDFAQMTFQALGLSKTDLAHPPARFYEGEAAKTAEDPIKRQEPERDEED